MKLLKDHYSVVIIGSGPAGMGAAYSLLNKGVSDIAILEREQQTGGAPKHCAHRSFGLFAFRYPMTGPMLIEKLGKQIQGVEVHTGVTVTRIRPGGEMDIMTSAGMRTLSADRVVIATGNRETARPGRLTSGVRPVGVINTGALQQNVYLKKLKPFKRPVIVDTELVSFSALKTLSDAGITPVAMIEENDRITAEKLAALYASFKRVPIHYQTQIVSINGRERVESVTVKNSLGQVTEIDCDGVLFTGRFIADNILVRNSHLDLDLVNGIPLVNESWRCSDPAYFAVGNLMHPGDKGDYCYLEGLQAGNKIADSLQAEKGDDASVRIVAGAGVKLVCPQVVNLKDNNSIEIHVRLSGNKAGTLRARTNNQSVGQKALNGVAERRYMLNVQAGQVAPEQSIKIAMD